MPGAKNRARTASSSPAVPTCPHEAVVRPIGKYVGSHVVGALELMDFVGKRHVGDPRARGPRHAAPLDRWQVGDDDARRVVIATLP